MVKKKKKKKRLVVEVIDNIVVVEDNERDPERCLSRARCLYRGGNEMAGIRVMCKLWARVDDVLR